MTFCPGKKQPWSATGTQWDRQLDVDVGVLVAWETAAVVTLNEAWELTQLGVPDLGATLSAAGIAWHHLPIVDGGVPDAVFERRWEEVGPRLHGRLGAGERVVVHCKGGLGRTGTIAARLLIESGIGPELAMSMVRQARPGAIENAAQESYVRRLQVAR
jgi:ADP-ribosyl-[dinitrogen reductase] hydrolase